MDRSLCVGWVSKAHGLKGEIQIKLFAKSADWLTQVHELGLLATKAQSGLKSSDITRWLKLMKVRSTPVGLIALLKDIGDRDAAEALEGLAVFVPVAVFETTVDETPYLHEMIGCEVVSAHGEVLGKVQEIGSNSFQDLLVVSGVRGPFEIPYVSPLIQCFDRQLHRIVVDIPPGLIDLNRK